MVNTIRITRECNTVLVKNTSSDQGSYYSCLASSVSEIFLVPFPYVISSAAKYPTDRANIYYFINEKASRKDLKSASEHTSSESRYFSYGMPALRVSPLAVNSSNGFKFLS